MLDMALTIATIILSIITIIIITRMWRNTKK